MTGARRGAGTGWGWGRLPGLAAALLASCGVPEPPEGTGGVEVGGDPGGCARGFVVVHTDYQSTSVSLLDRDGAVLSASFVSSGSAPAGLSAALSGDVVVPRHAPDEEHVLLVDRGSAVLTVVELSSAQVVGQLSVGTGFAANPQDYVRVSPEKAYLTRLDPNPAPGREPFDGGSDVLVVEAPAEAIAARVDLSPSMDGAPKRFFPRPSRTVVVGGRLYVLLAGYDASFIDTLASRLAVIDVETDALVEVFVLEGLHACVGLALSPSSERLAVTCMGGYGGGDLAALDRSGLAVLEIGETLREVERFPASRFGEGALGFSVDFASPRTLAFTTLGQLAVAGAPPLDDTLIQLDLTTGEAEVLLRSAGEPFTVEAVRCSCGVCVVGDASRGRGVVHRFEVDAGGALGQRSEITIGDPIGLPPRYLGTF